MTQGEHSVIGDGADVAAGEHAHVSGSAYGDGPSRAAGEPGWGGHGDLRARARHLPGRRGLGGKQPGQGQSCAAAGGTEERQRPASQQQATPVQPGAGCGLPLLGRGCVVGVPVSGDHHAPGVISRGGHAHSHGLQLAGRELGDHRVDTGVAQLLAGCPLNGRPIQRHRLRGFVQVQGQHRERWHRGGVEAGIGGQ
ncbi:hypothetical protein CYJ93_10225 [Micrococcus luteus]|nr:hypothetical protein CYJ93_10225 [Micrococcus luteus]